MGLRISAGINSCSPNFSKVGESCQSCLSVSQTSVVMYRSTLLLYACVPCCTAKMKPSLVISRALYKWINLNFNCLCLMSAWRNGLNTWSVRKHQFCWGLRSTNLYYRAALHPPQAHKSFQDDNRQHSKLCNVYFSIYLLTKTRENVHTIAQHRDENHAI